MINLGQVADAVVRIGGVEPGFAPRVADLPILLGDPFPTPAGKLLQGFNFSTGRKVEELATVIEDATILAL